MNRRVLKNEKGIAAIFIILGIAIIVMLCLIIIPEIGNTGSGTAAETDKAHEQTAMDSGRLQFLAVGPFTAVYDYKNKVFVDGAKAKQVEPYGETDEHKGMVIFVSANSEGKITVTWKEPREVPKQK